MGPVKMDQYTYESRLDKMNKTIQYLKAANFAMEKASEDLLRSLHNVGECPCVRCKEEREAQWPGIKGTVVEEYRDGSGTLIAVKQEDSSVELVPVEQDLQWEDDFRTVQLMARVNNQADLLDYKDKLIASLRHKWKCTFYLLLAWVALSMFYIVPVFV